MGIGPADAQHSPAICAPLIEAKQRLCIGGLYQSGVANWMGGVACAALCEVNLHEDPYADLLTKLCDHLRTYFAIPTPA